MRISLMAAMLIAAAAQAADVAGHYSLQNVREMGSELLLKPDGKFEFMLAYGAADYWSKGTWKSESGAVTLHTDDPEPKPPFRLTGSSSTKDEGVRVMVLAGGRPVPNIDVVLAGDGGPAEARTDSSGAAEFAPMKAIKSAAFRIRVYQFESEPIVLNAAHNEFRFEIDGREITKVRFQNERLAVDGKSLILRYPGVERPMRYTKE